MIMFYNTLTRKKEEFRSIEDKIVKMYTCGPTVYDFAHIGNFRAYVFEDLLHRFLEFAGFRVIRVMNITDIDDKTISGAIKNKVSLSDYTEKYINAFFEDMESLKLKKATYFPRATHHIPEMVSLIKILLERNIAYVKDGSIYFKISSFPSYGKLSHYNFDKILTSSTDSDEYDKEEARDFALWKATKDEPFFWDTEIGKGRPGWHIECSAMSMKYLGETFDIHTGGVDNIFPHHENEIAQSEAATGKKFVNYWLHCAHLLVNGEKMSKSKGNFYTLRDLLNRKYDPAGIRYLLLTTHYRDPLNFTEQSLKQAETTVKNLNAFCQRLSFVSKSQENSCFEIEKKVNNALENFFNELADDLNISAAMGGVFKLIHDVNEIFESGKLTTRDVEKIISFMNRINEIISVIEPIEETLPEDIISLIRKRELARKEKKYTLADSMRSQLAEKGILLEDTPYGTRWIKRQKTT